jgi:hypothetical protein
MIRLRACYYVFLDQFPDASEDDDDDDDFLTSDESTCDDDLDCRSGLMMSAAVAGDEVTAQLAAAGWCMPHCYY